MKSLWAVRWFGLIVLGSHAVLPGHGGTADSLRWTSAPSNALAGIPFTAGIEALDSGEDAANSFNGTVQLSVATRGTPARLLISEVFAFSSRGVELCNVSDGPAMVGRWRLTFYDATTWPAPRTTFVIPPGSVCEPGGVFRVSAGGNAPGFYPAFLLGTNLA